MSDTGSSEHRARGGKTPPTGTLGTFAGVFTPSILTILGIILFLRLGYVVGTAGLARALLIILLAHLISVLTSISLSAIATNLRVKGGGDYYLISRTLGVEYGGALGIVLFLAQSVSIAFYAIGFGEAVSHMAGLRAGWSAQLIAALAVAAVFALAWLGADWATRFQYVVMAILFAALVAFYAGGLSAWAGDQLGANLGRSGEMPFWTLFAIFFPAVTGFTQGVSMSGDLRDPGRSLPLGTFLAVGTSLVVYVTVAIVFAANLPAAELARDYGAMGRIAAVGFLVGAGVIAATLSSALASFLGAPRILQSLARDRVFPWLNFFTAGHGPTANPRRGVVLSAGIALGTIALGDLNVIAPVVAMFFLISYGLLNYATYFEACANSPSFRPRFRFFHARLSLAGCVACLGAMLAINPTAAAVAMAVLFALYQYLARSVRVARWADSDRSRRFQRVREDLHEISNDLEHPRYWRPVLLAFSDQAERRQRILRFASWLEGGTGFTTAIRLVQGEGPKARRTRDQAEGDLRAEIERGGFRAFARVVVAADIDKAVPIVLQAHGLGPVRPNTVLRNWFDRPSARGAPDMRRYGQSLRIALRFGLNVVILAAESKDFAAIEEQRPSRRRIDVWFRDNATGRLALLLAYLMTRSDEWKDAQLRLLSLAKDGKPDETLVELKQMLDDVRIPAEPEIVGGFDSQEVIRVSAGSSVAFVPFRLGDLGPTGVNDEPLDDVIRELGICALVLASQDIALDAEPEAGPHAEIAEAVDAADRAEKAAVNAEKEKKVADRDAARSVEKIDAAQTDGAGADEVRKLETEVEETRERAEQARRKAPKTRAKAETARKEGTRARTGRDEDPPPAEE